MPDDSVPAAGATFPAAATTASATTTDGGAAGVVHRFPLSLKEFCTRLSKTDHRVELIAAFYQDARTAQHLVDTETAFTTAFAAFAVRPV
ncbi:MAG: hypothetical protein P4M00_05205 [Azospirillaceae bacterium]|nr:hypothetical protein [Azospirillaceae bacterium]